MKKVYLVTKNAMKLKVAKSVLGDSLEQLPEDTPEIQSMDSAEIAAYSAKWAAEKFGKPVLKEDTSFFIEALQGFPGPFVAHVDKALGHEGIMKLMEGVKNRSSKFVTAVAYCEPGEEPIVEVSEMKGYISEKIEGEYGWFSDLFFVVEGTHKTMGCYPDEERNYGRQNAGKR